MTNAKKTADEARTIAETIFSQLGGIRRLTLMTGAKNFAFHAKDNGDDELDSRLQEGVDRMLPVLRDVGFRDDSTIVWYKAAGASHNESAWARRVWRPLLFMFGVGER